MALLQYLFKLIHMVKVFPMLLKIGHALEMYGIGKWEADQLQVGIGWTGKCFVQGLSRLDLEFNRIDRAKSTQISRGDLFLYFALEQPSLSVLVTYIIELILLQVSYTAPAFS
jgi:hypothetical protein